MSRCETGDAELEHDRPAGSRRAAPWAWPRPTYLQRHGTPTSPDELINHQAIILTRGGGREIPHNSERLTPRRRCRFRDG